VTSVAKFHKLINSAMYALERAKHPPSFDLFEVGVPDRHLRNAVDLTFQAMGVSSKLTDSAVVKRQLGEAYDAVLELRNANQWGHDQLEGWSERVVAAKSKLWTAQKELSGSTPFPANNADRVKGTAILAGIVGAGAGILYLDDRE
jgi:hypothetical protein